MGTFADFLGDIEAEKPQSQSAITDQILNNLKVTESGKDPYAVNKKTKALGAYQFLPETVQMLHKQGIEFNPFNEQESRSAAKTYLEQLTAKNGGDIKKALAQYGGFVKENPDTYVNKVLKGVTQNAPVQAQEPAKSDFSNFLEDVSEPTKQPEVAPAPIVQKAQPTNQPAPRQMNAGEKMYQDRISALKNLGIGLSSLADVTVGGVIPAVAGATTYPLARVLRSPEDAQNITNQVTSALEKPFGKALGVTENPVYKGEASKRLMDLVGEIGEAGLAAASGMVMPLVAGAKGIVQSIPEAIQTGQAPAPIAEKIASKFLAEHPGYQPTTPQGKAYIENIQKAFEASKLPPVMPEIIGQGPNTKPVSEAAGKVGGAAIKAGQQFAQDLKEVTATPMKTEIVQPEAVAPGSAGAAKVTTNPYPKFTGQETGKGGEFPMVKLSNISKDVSPKEQQTRAQIATEILGNKDAVRSGVVTGNEDTLRNEHTEAKSANQTPKAQVLREQIANEQNALSNYAQKRIENTGASPTLTSDYERGQAINDAFAGDQGLTGFFKTEKNRLYDEARAKVGENPIKTNNVDNLLSNEQFRAGLGLKGNEGVAASAEKLINLAKTMGFEDEFGNKYAPNTIGAWDAVRKSLNADWTPSNASVIRKINNAIDNDIAGAGGQELFKKADQLHQAEKTLFGSKGIKSIFGDIDPNGVQKGTPFEQIPAKLNKIPKDEWVHIFDTADKISKGVLNGPIEKETGLPKWTIEVPEEVRQNAERAKAEIKGAIAREVYENGSKRPGVWNQKDVNSILNARSEKIKHAFDPEEVKAFHTLNIGSQIMPGIHGYEGAGQQVQRLGIIASNAPKIGATTGASIGGAFAGPTGAAVGGYVGQRVGTAYEQSSLEKALNKAATETQKEMKKNAQKANILNLRDNKKD